MSLCILLLFQFDQASSTFKWIINSALFFCDYDNPLDKKPYRLDGLQQCVESWGALIWTFFRTFHSLLVIKLSG